jgi:hypothetical protein
MASRRPLLTSAVIVLGLAAVFVVAFWAGKVNLFAPAPPEMTPSPSEPPVVREIILYFSDPQAEFLMTESREIVDCGGDRECVRAVVEELILGSREGLIEVLPPQAKLLAVEIEGQTAVLDFSRDLITRHPGGSISELLTVHALANTVAVNFPHLRQVRILVAGEAVETLKGHVDVRAPIAADFRLTRPPSDGQTNDHLDQGGSK